MFTGLVCALGTSMSLAAVDLSATATVGAEYNSNPIELSKGEADDFKPGGLSELDDVSSVVTAAVSAKTGANGPLRTQLQAMYSHNESRRFNKLGHSDYGLDLNVDWQPGRVFDASLVAGQIRSPIRQADVGSTETAQKTTQNARMTMRLRPTPEWQLSLTPAWNHIELPLTDAPDFRSRETIGSVGIGYLGVGRVVPGIAYDESRTRNSGIGGATRYRQHTVSGTLNFQTPGFSTFSLWLGRSSRVTHLVTPTDDPGALANAGHESAFTGRLTYQRTLSVKTAINLSLFRELQQYEAGVNTTKNTGFTTGITWLPTSRLSLTLDTTYVYSIINDLQVTGSIIKRDDLTRSGSLGVSYRATRLVSVRTYVTHRLRNSTFRASEFSGTIAGLELSAKLD
jgi:hypothetical protein